MSIKDDIAAGPKFEAHEITFQSLDGATRVTVMHSRCDACQDEAIRDETTGLCRPCWRAWRWSEDGLAEADELADESSRRRTGGPLP